MTTPIRVPRGVMVLLAAAALCALVVPAVAFGARTISLSAGKVEIALPPSGSVRQELSVANTADETVTAFVYTADAKPQPNGQMDYERPDPKDPVNTSPAQWISLKIPEGTKTIANTPYLELSPGEEVKIEYDVSVPANASPGDYNAVIFFEMFERDPATGASVASVSGRIGTRVRIRVVGDVDDSLVVQPFIARTLVLGDGTPFSLAVVNDGNVDNTATVTLELVGSGEDVVWEKSLDKEVIIYADTERMYDGGVKFEGVSMGRYTFRAVAEYEQEDTSGAAKATSAEVERTVWIIPLWLAIAVLVVLGVIVAWIVWRFTGKGAPKKPVDPTPSSPPAE